MDILTSIRPLDYVLTAVLVALGVLSGSRTSTRPADADVAHELDSQSALMIPVFVLATLPILLRRQHILGAIGACSSVMTASVLAFGWVTRCGFALPLAFAMAYAVARFAGSRQNQILGLVGIVALQIVTLMQDSSTGGLAALALSLPRPLSPTASACSCNPAPGGRSVRLRCPSSTPTPARLRVGGVSDE